MSGVNSINWARIISQIVYYFYAFFKIEEKGKKINFSVPTGNFGDVYAGYISKRMGLSINKLIVATNRNDILKRAINTGEYKIADVVETISPSMDIQVASNFERLIFDINSNDDSNVKEKMKNLKEQKFFKIDNNQLKSIKHDFVSESLSEKETQNIIKNFYNKFNVILDPHTAVGYGVLNKISSEGINVVLATAHPCKFPEVINKAIGLKPNLPKELDYIMSAKENYDLIPNNLDKIKNHILEKI
jgi:threonine synthase